MTLLNNKQPLAHEVVEDSNPTDNIDFQTIISRRLNRRSILKGGTGLTAAAFFGALPFWLAVAMMMTAVLSRILIITRLSLHRAISNVPKL